MTYISRRIKSWRKKSNLSATESYRPSQEDDVAEPQPSPAVTTIPKLGGESELPVVPPKSAAELDAITEQNQLVSPFLCLPGEVRNRIYHYAFGGHEIYAMPSGLRRFVCMGRPDDQFAWNLKPISQIMALHLPLVCRQIQSETGKYFAFKFNTFGSTMPEYFQLLMESLTAEQKNRIEVVKMNHASTPGSPDFRTAVIKPYEGLKTLKNLRLLVVRDWGNTNEWNKGTTIKYFRRIAGNETLEIIVERIGSR